MSTLNQNIVKLPTNETLEAFIKWDSDETKVEQEGWEHRMNNYYNCVDDYSWGGICDKAAAESRAKRRLILSDLKEQLTDGALVRTESVSVLCDLNGSIVSEKIVRTKYGQAWVIERENLATEFVSVAKNQATYNKKGYKVAQLVHTYSYRMHWTNSNWYKPKFLLIDLTTEFIDSMPEYQSTCISSELWMMMKSV